MRTLLLALAIAISSEAANAKSDTTASLPIYQKPITTGITLGVFTGIGINGKIALTEKINVRIGASLFPASLTREAKIEDVSISAKAKSTFTKIQALGEYRPFSFSSFRLVAGIAYYATAKVDIDAKPTSGQNYGKIELTPEHIGTLHGNANWKGIAPYIGIGLFNSIPSRKFNVNADLGTFYLSRPTITLHGTNLLKGNEANEDQLNENMKGYRWLPQLQLNFNYRIQ
ncbi:MAG: hypothetical protein EOP56_10105 [Sphingobacteriales bacterium]|nr:MAG: hypothetical protein EOP56_10105 [Sphingobacteriales bacterium]